MSRLARGWRQDGHDIAMVPTMGNLHQGHLSLLQRARKSCAKVVASIFINPDQFNDKNDFKNYPRSMKQDLRQLRTAGVDAVFTPGTEQMFPQGMKARTKVHVPIISEVLCGKYREGHFTGVTSIVAQLFAICQPDVAIFGEKDYQQLLLIKRMCHDLRLPVRIISAPTVRCDDGLAMSSRNGLLTEKQRATAPMLYSALLQVAKEADSNNYKATQRKARAKLQKAGFKVEYLQVLQQHNLQPPGQDGNQARLRVFAAAWLGTVRLIDNVAISKHR